MTIKFSTKVEKRISSVLTGRGNSDIPVCQGASLAQDQPEGYHSAVLGRVRLLNDHAASARGLAPPQEATCSISFKFTQGNPLTVPCSGCHHQILLSVYKVRLIPQVRHTVSKLPETQYFDHDTSQQVAEIHSFASSLLDTARAPVVTCTN